MPTSSAAPLADPILAVAVRAARRAASVIADASRDLRRLPTFSKEHGDIVSVADKDAEAAIRATLTAAFPDHAVLGEEEGDKGHSDATARWIVDPIDGTRNFVHGFPYYAVSIALSQDGTLTHAVVLDPVHDELFTAVRGKGAQRNGAPIHVSACTRLGEALIGTVLPAPRAIPADAQCADGPLRRHPPGGRLRARPRAPRRRTARRLLRHEPGALGCRGWRAPGSGGRRAGGRFRGRQRLPAQPGSDRGRAGPVQSAA
jgi:inositol monophosphatase family protein